MPRTLTASQFFFIQEEKEFISGEQFLTKFGFNSKGCKIEADENGYLNISEGSSKSHIQVGPNLWREVVL